MEERDGTILSVTNKILKDNVNGQDYEFINPAVIDIIDGSIVVYVVVSTPNKVIRVIKEIKH